MSRQTDFINSIKDGAIASMKRHGVLASITIAQAILESNWGQSQLSVDAFNLFGIKAIGNEQCVVMRTAEYSSTGKKYYIDAKFRKYSSYADSIEDHALFLVSNSRYRKKGLFESKDYRVQAKVLQEAGYATDPCYSKQLIQLIGQYELNKYDTIESQKYKVPYCQEFQRWYNKVTQTKKPLVEDNSYGPATEKCLSSITDYVRQGPKYKYCLEFQKFYNEVTKTKAPLIEDGDYGPNTEKALQAITSIIREF